MPDHSNLSFPNADSLQKQGYEVISVLGKGGNGVVYQAMDKRLERKVAIKVLHDNHPFQEKIANEARLLATFNHPHIVQIYDILTIENGENGGDFAIVMEYIEGKNLAKWLAEKAPSEQDKLTQLLTLAFTLTTIHQQGIVHGDLKPTNLLMRTELQCVITDFGEGFANTSYPEQRTHSTENWTAPEVYTQGEPTEQSDIYSFALIVLWALTQWHPGVDNAEFNRSKAAHDQFIEKLDAFASSLPDGLLSLLKKMLCWDSKQRAPSMSHVALELGQIQRNTEQSHILKQDTLPIDGIDEPETAVYKSSRQPDKSSAHNRKGFLLAGTMVLTMIALVTVYLLNQKPEPKFIALIPPEVTGSLDDNREQLLASAVTHAIENNIINNQNFLLIPSADIRGVIRQAKEQEDGPLNLTKIVGNAMGATDVISVSLDCAITHCDVALSRSEKASEVGKWAVSLSDRFSTPLVDNLRFSDSVAQRFPKLFELDQEYISGANDISEEAYIRYLEIVREFRENEGGGDLDGLLAELETLIEAYPDFYSWYWLYREVALKQHHYSKDNSYFSRITKTLDQSPLGYQNTIAYQIDRFWLFTIKEDFKASHEVILELQEKETGEETLNYFRAILAFQQQLHRESIKYLTLVARYNKSSDILHNLALSYWYVGEMEQVIDILGIGINLNPLRLDLKQLLATAFLITGRLDEAETLYIRIMDITESSNDLSNLSIVKVLQKNYSEALSYATKAVELDPSNYTWVLNLADTLKLDGRIKEANEQYSKVLSMIEGDESMQGRLVIAQASAHLGLADIAINQIESVKKDYPENGYVYFNAALIYTLIDSPMLAMFHVEEALQLEFDEIWFSLPWFSKLCKIEKTNSGKKLSFCYD